MKHIPNATEWEHLDKRIVKKDPLRPKAKDSELPDHVHLFFQYISFGRWEEDDEEEEEAA